MKLFFSKIGFLFFILVFYNDLKIKADIKPLDSISSQNNTLLVESNKQRSDLENSIFYAEGDVTITNTNKEFIAKSAKAIFYKLSGKIKLMGNVEVITSDLNKIKAGVVFYSLKENKFEAISDENQRVKTKLIFNEK